MTTVTNNYSLVQPVVGGDINLWGGELNNGVIAALDGILGNVLAVAMTSADVTLTPAQFQNAIFNVSGTLVGSRNLIIPLQTNSLTVACGGTFVVINNTTAIFTVKTQAVGSTGVVVPVGFAAFLYSDGTNVNYCANGLPAYATASNGNPNGQLAGTAGSATTNASIAWDYVNFLFYICTTSGSATGTPSPQAVWSQPTVVVNRGFDTPVNLSITATHTAGNLLQVVFNQTSGSAPTAGSPIIGIFQTVNGSGNTTGIPVAVNATSALTMTTFATGASFGATSNTPFRVWYALFNNAGTMVPAMRVCSALVSGAWGTYAIAEYGVASTTAVSSGANQPGVWYTPSGITLTNCAWRVVGYSEWLPGNLLATAGTYTADPSNTVIYSPGIHLPGDTVQIFQPFYDGSNQATTGTPTATPLAKSINLSSACNLVRARAFVCSFNGPNSSFFPRLGRNSSSNLFGNTPGLGQSSGDLANVTPCSGIDLPGTTGSTNYAIYISGNSSNYNLFAGTGGQTTSALELEEIMG
jgi:hypothetical protein